MNIRKLVIIILVLRCSSAAFSQQSEKFRFAKSYSCDSVSENSGLFELLNDSLLYEFPASDGKYHKSTYLEYMVLDAYSSFHYHHGYSKNKACLLSRILKSSDFHVIKDSVALALLYFSKCDSVNLNNLKLSKTKTLSPLVDQLLFSMNVLNFKYSKNDKIFVTQLDSLFLLSRNYGFYYSDSIYVSYIPVLSIAYSWYIANPILFRANFKNKIAFYYELNPPITDFFHEINRKGSDSYIISSRVNMFIFMFGRYTLFHKIKVPNSP